MQAKIAFFLIILLNIIYLAENYRSDEMFKITLRTAEQLSKFQSFKEGRLAKFQLSQLLQKLHVIEGQRVRTMFKTSRTTWNKKVRPER